MFSLQFIRGLIGLDFLEVENKLKQEFESVRNSVDPKIDAGIEAVAILSGESGDPALKTNLRDTEQRTAYGLTIYKKLASFSSRGPKLVLTGTEAQNDLMRKLAKNIDSSNVIKLSNMPPVPLISTLDQFKELGKLNFKKLAIVTHAYHGPRSARYARKYLGKKDYEFFLLDRRGMNPEEIKSEIGKIIKYFMKKDLT
ncbi:MAG: YdcF family protein [Candidatus Curtissbacteria bacterium]|nr:YdcF family protein [Candidatus Curtissbacteria bacterium]